MLSPPTERPEGDDARLRQAVRERKSCSDRSLSKHFCSTRSLSTRSCSSLSCSRFSLSRRSSSTSFRLASTDNPRYWILSFSASFSTRSCSSLTRSAPSLSTCSSSTRSFSTRSRLTLSSSTLTSSSTSLSVLSTSSTLLDPSTYPLYLFSSTDSSSSTHLTTARTSSPSQARATSSMPPSPRSFIAFWCPLNCPKKAYTSMKPVSPSHCLPPNRMTLPTTLTPKSLVMRIKSTVLPRSSSSIR